MNSCDRKKFKQVLKNTRSIWDIKITFEVCESGQISLRSITFEVAYFSSLFQWTRVEQRGLPQPVLRSCRTPRCREPTPHFPSDPFETAARAWPVSPEKFVSEFLSLLFLFTASSTVMTLSMQARVRIRDLVASTPNMNPFKASKLGQREI